MSNWILLRGVNEPPAQRLELRAGPLTLQFEAGTLRYIRLGEQEVLRHIYMALRPPDWSTVVPVISNLKVDSQEDHFEITFDADHKQGEIDFSWQGHITGDRQGTIRFSMEGIAHRNFWRARLGFCVLHPMSVAGLPVELLKKDGTRERSMFPKAISPHQPFMDLQGMIHEVRPGIRAEVRFEGEVFETEDHRNWTDASFKTYCTPLALPRPVEVKAGEKISQSVTLFLHYGQEGEEDKIREQKDPARFHTPALFTPPQPKPLRIEGLVTANPFPLPRIGLGMASHGQSLTPKEIARLKLLNLSHLRVDLPLFESDYRNRLQRAGEEAEKLGVDLEVALILSDVAREELMDLRDALFQIKPRVCTWLIFHIGESSTTEKWIQLARPVLKEYAPAAKVGAGTNAYFTEINRGHPPVALIDLVSYSINPQVHAFDDATLVENLETQGVTVQNARRIIGDKLLAISPVTLRPRLQPNGSPPEPKAIPGELPPQVDVRQTSLFGACWTTGSLKYLLEEGIYSVTYYETTGWRGVMETEQGSPLPEKFPSRPGTVFPLYHVLADVGQFIGGTVIPTRSSDILRANGLGLRKNGHTRFIVMNLSPVPEQVTVAGLPSRVWIRPLDEQNVEQAMQEPETFYQENGKEVGTEEGHLKFEMLPYGLVRIDYRR
ncbi:MAG TPA: hypothetical protein VNM22_07700 [Candidatus Limnocylindrales bacterium]|nr:hypothetical protein [Candidatus Limnocylindrales bacterium]